MTAKKIKAAMEKIQAKARYCHDLARRKLSEARNAKTIKGVNKAMSEHNKAQKAYARHLKADAKLYKLLLKADS